MNVDTHFGVWGAYRKTQYPDGSITLTDDQDRHIDIKLGEYPLRKADVEALFDRKYEREAIREA